MFGIEAESFSIVLAHVWVEKVESPQLHPFGKIVNTCALVHLEYSSYCNQI